MKESVIEKYLADKVKAAGGEVRKVVWVGRKNAPDRLVMLPVRAAAFRFAPRHRTLLPPRVIFVEVKNPDTIKTFPANAHERAQAREHERMRKLGCRVEVVGTKEQVDALFA